MKLIRFDLFGIFAVLLGLLCSSLAISSSADEIMTLLILFVLITPLVLVFWKNYRVTITYFLSWALFVYFLGYIRIKILGNLPMDSVIKVLVLIAISIFVFVVFYLGFECRKIARKIINSKWTGDLECALFSRRVLCAIVLLYVLLLFHKIFLAGGVMNYLFMSYGVRNDPETSYLFALRGVIQGSLLTISLVQIVFCKRKNVGWLVYLFIVMVSIIEGSTGLLVSIPIQLGVSFVFKYLLQGQIKNINRLFLIMLILLPVAITITSYIRIARAGSSEIASLVTGRTFDALENTVRIVSYYSPATTLGIHTFIYPLTANLIPRKIWTAKPVGVGRQIMWDIYGAPEDTPVSFAPGFLGEIYLDFGYIVGIWVFGFFGCLVKLLDEMIDFSKRKRIQGLLIFFILMALLTANIPNSLQGFSLRLILYLIQVMFILFVYKIVKFLCRIKLL